MNESINQSRVENNRAIFSRVISPTNKADHDDHATADLRSITVVSGQTSSDNTAQYSTKCLSNQLSLPSIYLSIHLSIHLPFYHWQ
jgi:hypothetical protein